MQQPPPEGPDPLPLQAPEERPLLQPPLGTCGGELRQPPLRQPDVLIQIGLNGRVLTGWPEPFDRRPLGADELGEEAALREDLVDQDRPEGVRLLVRLEVYPAIALPITITWSKQRFPDL